MVEEIPKNRCNRCGGTGFDPEDHAETMVYTRSGDVDVRYDPMPCRRCEGSCKEIMEDLKVK